MTEPFTKEKNQHLDGGFGNRLLIVVLGGYYLGQKLGEWSRQSRF